MIRKILTCDFCGVDNDCDSTKQFLSQVTFQRFKFGGDGKGIPDIFDACGKCSPGVSNLIACVIADIRRHGGQG